MRENGRLELQMLGDILLVLKCGSDIKRFKVNATVQKRVKKWAREYGAEWSNATIVCFPWLKD